jgi:hypothetical protein
MSHGIAILNHALNPLIAVACSRHHRHQCRLCRVHRSDRHALTAARRELERAVVSALRFAVINYTGNPAYVVFAALGSWRGAFLSVTWLNRRTPVVAPLQPGSP